MTSLAAGSASAEVRPDVGGRLGQLVVDGVRLLRGEDEAQGLGWAYWGSYPLLPWSNRIPGGRFGQWQVPVNWKDGTAIHGLTAWVPWSVDSADATSASLSVEVDTAPWRVRGEQRYVLRPDGLTHELAVTNLGDDAVPVGLGIHPWFRATEVRIPAASIWPAVECLPVGPPRPVTAEEGLRDKRVPPPLDACYTDLLGDSADVGDIRLSWEGPVTQVVLYSEEPGWLCVEPVTMANDGFGLAASGTPGHGVLTLAPDTRTAVTYHLAW
jgi:aldose 1-epimerase